MKVASLFRPGTRAFWGTTYGFGLALFDQYLLRQFGGPPLNAVLLADHSKLSETWNSLDPQELYLARQANRVYPAARHPASRRRCIPPRRPTCSCGAMRRP